VKVTNEELGVEYKLESDLRQRHIEAFFMAQREIRDGRLSMPVKSLADAVAGFLKQLAGMDIRPGTPDFALVFGEFASTLRATHQPRRALTKAEDTGVIVRAAARSGLVEALAEDAVGDMAPAVVVWLANEVDQAIGRAYAISGE
jgi:hypothetical protein